MKSCHLEAKSDKMPAEIRPKTFDSPGCSLTLQPLSVGVDSLPRDRVSSRVSGNPVLPDVANGDGTTGTSNAPIAQKLPDPWLFDSAALIREIDRIRETALQVPTNGDANATHFGLQQVINAAWTLRENLRYVLALHKDGQRRFGRRSDKHQTVYDLSCWLLGSCA